MSDLLELTFFCQTREMPVMKDTTDCWGCPFRLRGCEQFAHWHHKTRRGELGYIPDLFADTPLIVVKEPSTPQVTE